MSDERFDYAECPDEECLADGPHPVLDGGRLLECCLCHCEFPNPHYHGPEDSEA